MLLHIIKQLTYSFEDWWKLADALSNIKEAYYKLQQREHETLQEYCEQYESCGHHGAVFANTSLDGEIALSHRHPVAIAEDEHEV